MERERRWQQQQLGGEMVETKGREAAVAAAAVVVVGEPFGSDNGKHSFSLRVSVHQCRGPQRREGDRLCQLTANTRHSYGNALGSQLPSCPTNKMGSIQASSPPRKTERGYKTVNSGAWAYLGICGFRFFFFRFLGGDRVLLRN